MTTYRHNQSKPNIDNFSCVCAGKRRNTQGNKTKDSAFPPQKAKSLGPGAGVLGAGLGWGVGSSASFQKSLFNACFLLTPADFSKRNDKLWQKASRTLTVTLVTENFFLLNFFVWLSAPLLKFFYLHFPKLLFVENSLLRSNHRTRMEQWQKLQIQSLVS